MDAGSRARSQVHGFVHQINGSQVLAAEEASLSPPRKFVPLSVLERFLTPEPIRTLLNYFLRLTTYWKAIQNGYLRVFAILVCIGEATYISHFLSRRQLDDEHLPFLRPDDWPDPCRKFFDRFSDAQWQFCAQKLEINRLNDTIIYDAVIIPITRRHVLKEGPDSSTYVIEIHPDYNYLVERDKHGNPVTNTFLLKTCSVEKGRYHHNEVEAYKALSESEDGEPQMARFYGSWIHRTKYNMVLEYVGGGTLTQFFERTEPPSQAEDTLKFWKGLLDIVKPLLRIHLLPNSYDTQLDSEEAVLQGIHHDVKPDNILVTLSSVSSPFDVVFKLADLGLTEFKLNIKRDEEIASPDVRGTQMFSAPEYYMNEKDKFLQRIVLEAKPSKDIWALGCVLSEAAVWSVFGMTGLDQYRRDRAAATGNIPQLRNTAYSGCFHDGHKVLQVVRDFHTRVRMNCRRNDHVVAPVLDLIGDMLREVSSRPNARQVYDRCHGAMESAKDVWRREWNLAQPGHYPKIFCTDDDPFAGTRQEPPQSPPGVNAMGLGVTFDADTNSPANGTSGGYTYDNRASSTSLLPSPVESNLEKHQSLSSSGDAGPSSQQISPIREHHAESATQSAAAGNINPLPLVPQTHNGTPVPPKQGSTPQPLSNPASGPAPSSVHNSTHPSKSSKSQAEHDKNREEFPEITVKDVEEWIVQLKKNSNHTPFKGYEYLKRLEGRDQIFLFDDSSSMKPYWDEVKRTFRALGYLVKHKDPDGMEIRFTNAPLLSGCNKDREPLMVILNGVQPGGQCDIGLTFGKILSELRSENIKKESKFRWRKKKWGANIYVLTDGVWEDGDDWLRGVVEPIKALLDKGMQNRQLGVQFIRFGNDPEGTKRLKKLDDELREEGVTKDIIDTEPWSGNVFKMLLGSFDPAWDRYKSKAASTPTPAGAASASGSTSARASQVPNRAAS